jgi:hypothetical protein
MKCLVFGTGLHLTHCPACGCLHLDMTDDETNTFARLDIELDDFELMIETFKNGLAKFKRGLQ